jgi:acyl-CoA reductase-like NAD-dependent aldehyde dehydrogenase
MAVVEAAHVRMLLGGEWVDSDDGRRIEVESPAVKRVIATVPRATEREVDRAVKAAAAAFTEWRRVPPRERGHALLRIADDLEPEVETIARTVASETGNAIRPQARPEARQAVDIFRYFGGLATELKGETIPLGEDLLSYSRREPIGVVGSIIPWNSPIMLGAMKIAMALATGNTLVLKAAEAAPLGVLKMAEVCARHLPVGVLNVLTGYGEECGAPLARHPGVGKLSFTGSTEVGKSVMHAAADRIVPVSLELGGKSPTVVFPDADEEATVEGVVTGMRFTRQGQSCTAGSRLFLHESIVDSFLSKLTEGLRGMRIGDPLDDETDMGSLINRTQFERVCSYVDGALQEGGRAVLGGLPPSEGPLAAGYFFQPTVFTGITPEWRIAREEVFGPVMVVIPWKDEAEVVAMANDSHYGLAAFVWSHDLSRALRVAHAIESGWVQVNRGAGQSLGESYGGYKQSGLGREFSIEGALESFTRRKSVTVSLTF